MTRLLARLRAWYVRRRIAELQDRAVQYDATGEHEVAAEMRRMIEELEGKRDGR
jgi:hypothetical protein